MSGTLLLPVPPEHGDEAKAALASAVNDDEQVEISVMLARESGGGTVSVVFGSFGALAAWAPAQHRQPAAARRASPIANLAAAGHAGDHGSRGPGPLSLRRRRAGRAGRRDGCPGSDEPLFEPTARSSIRVRTARPRHPRARAEPGRGAARDARSTPPTWSRPMPATGDARLHARPRRRRRRVRHRRRARRDRRGLAGGAAAGPGACRGRAVPPRGRGR